MKIIRISDNGISGARDLLVPEAIYKNALIGPVWFNGDCCCRGFRLQLDESLKTATLETDCSIEKVDVEVLPGPPHYEGPTRIPELVLTLYQ